VTAALQPFDSSDFRPLLADRRRAQRKISALACQGAGEMARVEMEGALAAHRIQCFAAVVNTALTSASLISASETQLALNNPAASGELAFLKGIAANVTAQMLADAGRKMM
jgi:hypothetical protein